MLYYSNMQSISKQNKLDVLVKQPKKLFHTHDLELLWNINNKSTLYSTINRYLKNGYLIQVHRGFYSTVRLDDINPIELGTSAFHEYCYLTTETVLANSGVIFQIVPHLTFCSSKNRRLMINNQSFVSRQLKPAFLFQSAGIVEQSNYRQASPERAIADMLYFNPHYYFDAHDTIDWKKVKEIQKEVGYI